MHGLNVAQSHGKMPVISANIDPTAMYRPAHYLRPVGPVREAGPAADLAVPKLVTAHPVLGTLADHEQRALLGLSRIRTVARQHAICQQQDPGNAVILMLAGHAKLSRTDAEGREVFFDIAGPGDCVGDVSVMQKRPYDADLTTLSPCRVLLIDARQFRQVFERRPDSLLAMLGLADERLQRIAAQLEEICTLTAAARLAKALLRLERSASFTSTGGGALQLSQHELGVMTGVCREVINKQLRVWKAAGWITLSHGMVTSIRRSALESAAGGTDCDIERRTALG
jgi:CRP/FNR family transcriptional regulator, cyclic AMP receptor protein